MDTFIKIIDNKKISMTIAEWEMYQSICRAYDRPAFNGEELFKNLFDSNDEGIITFIKPPSSRFTSMEVFFFIASLAIHQHIREMYNVSRALFSHLNDRVSKIENQLIDLKKV